MHYLQIQNIKKDKYKKFTYNDEVKEEPEKPEKTEKPEENITMEISDK